MMFSCHANSLPSSVNVKLLVSGPNPAEVLALTETLYGIYLSATTKDIATVLWYALD